MDVSNVKNIPIFKHIDLTFKDWVICYDPVRHFNLAQTLVDMLYQSSHKLGITVDYPDWIEVPYMECSVFEDKVKKLMETK